MAQAVATALDAREAAQRRQRAEGFLGPARVFEICLYRVFGFIIKKGDVSFNWGSWPTDKWMEAYHFLGEW